MAAFVVNGTPVTVEKNQKLIRFLRDEMHLTSVKDGCSEGACGTCHVLIDGKPTKACIPQTDKLEGKHIVTVEGLSDFEKEAFTYAFGEAGAVQCGFCIPGMVISAKALLDQNPDPTREEAAFAIRNNICRCTGYVKIIDGILLAAKILREGKIPQKEEDFQIGSRVHRIDVAEKVQGYGKYPDDVYVDGMCYGGAVRSEYPRARVLYIRTKEAEELPGVVCVLTAKDIPGQQNVGHIQKDQPTLVGEGEITQYLGDAVALVCARDQETLERAKKLVRVVYEELPAVHSPEEAKIPGAPEVIMGNRGNVQAHRHVARGNAEEAIKNSKYGVKLLTTDQSAHTTQHECSAMLGVDFAHCQVENMLVGGGFGGKEDMSVQHHAALIAYIARVPVKVKLSRQESILVHPKRHPMWMDFTMGCDENGIIQGVKAKVVSDTGGFASLGGPVLERACTHAAGPYHYENFEIEGHAYYTNNPPAGAFRGFGVTQTCFATETLLNEMADLVGISPWEIRYRNAIRPETLEAIKPYYDEAVKNGEPVGLACAMKNAGVGVGLPDYGRCKLVIDEEGKVHIRTGASCIGQGLGTVLVQIVVTNAGLRREDVVYDGNSTFITPDSGDTSGSRQTLITGEACRRACLLLRDAMENRSLSDLAGQEFYGEYYAKTNPLGADVPNPVSHVAYGYATQMCIVDKETGLIKKMVAAHDVGKAINPLSCEGQIEGGVVMSMGYALTEKFPLDHGKPTAKYGMLGLFRANQIPEIKALVIDKPGLNLANGAIGIGEITSIPTAPAIADAYFRYDGERRRSLPLDHTPYKK